MTVPGPLTARCQAALAAHGHVLDASQRAALARLEDLRRRVLTREGARSLIERGLSLLPGARSQQPLRGIWLWGAVGRGKTFLVDQFFGELPVAAKRREHFHRFMQGVHAGLRSHRNEPSPLARVASDIAHGARILCLDEFTVGDVADAMILGTLLEGLFREGIALVATSNLPPQALYRGGLQRERFLPAIALIERHCRVQELEGGADYRLRLLERAALFLGPGTPDAERRLAAEFERISDSPVDCDARIEVNGRSIRARREADDLAWFDFRELCEGPRAAADYIEIARCYHTVFVSGVPAMDGAQDDAARRFITLVDEFYDRGVKLFLSAAADTPEGLYRGGRLALEYRRTASRLHEMQGRAYLARPHL
ncbi:MAG TPA: cell division protein ZapE, partial [Steroidobacteraceae bacterium]|nr:cell division protein ZapE [Steroidobacteraceae bacterium]